VTDTGVRLPTADGGEITADMDFAEDAWAVAVLCHPHPAYGGDRHNIVVDTFFRRLPSAGISVLRFDFRSDDLAAAQADVTAALDRAFADDQPLWLVGYSFGGDVALSAGDSRVAGWIAVAPPFRFGSGDGDGDAASPTAASDERPVLLLAADHDQFNPPDRMREEASTWRNTTVEAIAGADHFMAGATARVVDATLAWLPH
jgi:alpha/beta superfamily hydrolase